MAGVEEKQDLVEGGIVSTMRRADPGSSGEDWGCFVMGAIREPEREDRPDVADILTDHARVAVVRTDDTGARAGAGSRRRVWCRIQVRADVV